MGQRFDSLKIAGGSDQHGPRDAPAGDGFPANSAAKPSPAWLCPICGSPRNGPVGPPAAGQSISTAPWIATPAWTDRGPSASAAWPMVPNFAVYPGRGPGEDGPPSAPTASSSLFGTGGAAPCYGSWTVPKSVLLLDRKGEDCVFRPDSRQLASTHPDGTLRLFDLPSGRLLKQLSSRARVLFGRRSIPRTSSWRCAMLPASTSTISTRGKCTRTSPELTGAA